MCFEIVLLHTKEKVMKEAKVIQNRMTDISMEGEPIEIIREWNEVMVKVPL